jgi:hypothetical protein
VVGTPERLDGWVQGWGVVVGPMQMLETVFSSHAGAYHHPSRCAYDAALCGSEHAQAAQMRQWTTPHLDGIPGMG